MIIALLGSSAAYRGGDWDVSGGGEGDGDDALGEDLAVLPDGGDEGGHAHGGGRLDEAVVGAGADVRDGAVLDDDLLGDDLGDGGVLDDDLLDDLAGWDVLHDDLLDLLVGRVADDHLLDHPAAEAGEGGAGAARSAGGTGDAGDVGVLDLGLPDELSNRSLKTWE